MDSKLVIAIIAFIFGLPTGMLSAALMSPRRGRFLQFLGALVGAVATGTGVFAYATTITVDGLSYGLGAYLAIATGAIVGALTADFLVSLRDRRPGNVQTEL
ncbi:MAG TPA: hypothetical protein VKC57_05620 [Ktedonobacterales bacterium]|nr:hypothetical protein [Ktedonobacterales bacterium]